MSLSDELSEGQDPGQQADGDTREYGDEEVVAKELRHGVEP